jgi:hypothetical protein
VSTAVAQRPFLLTVGDRRAVNRCQVGVDHSRLGMGSIAECLAKQALGSAPNRKGTRLALTGSRLYSILLLVCLGASIVACEAVQPRRLLSLCPWP